MLNTEKARESGWNALIERAEYRLDRIRKRERQLEALVGVVSAPARCWTAKRRLKSQKEQLDNGGLVPGDQDLSSTT
jgi:hypothetical protein